MIDEAQSRFVAKEDDFIIHSKKAPCKTCVHKNKGSTCKAFPDRIPKAMLSGQNDHTQPYEGDNGIQFESA